MTASAKGTDDRSFAAELFNDSRRFSPEFFLILSKIIGEFYHRIAAASRFCIGFAQIDLDHVFAERVA